MTSTDETSAITLINETAKTIQRSMALCLKVVSKLSDNIGGLVHPISDGLVDLGNMWAKIVKQFQNRFVERKRGNDENIDFKGIMECGQRMANMIGLIAETALDDCGRVTIPNDTFDAIAVLIIILNDCFVGIQFLIVSMASVLHSESFGISDFLHSSLLTLDSFIKDVGHAIISMTTDINRSVRFLLTKVVSLLSPLNAALDNLLGLGKIAKNTIGLIKKNLLKL